MSLWNNVTIHTSPTIYASCSITSQSRNGNTQSYSLSISVSFPQSYAIYENRIACNVKVGGISFANNLTIKATTIGTNIGYQTYTANCSGSINVSGDTGSTTVVVDYIDTAYGTNYNFTLATKSASVSYNPLPVVSLSTNSYNNNSANLSYTYKNVSPSKVDVYVNNSYNKTVTSTPFTIEGLNPKTYYEVKAYGYANGGWGSSGNTVSFTTYPNPVTITGIKITDIQPFQATVNLTLSSAVDMNNIEYILMDEEGGTIKTYTGNNVVWTVTLDPEKSYKVKVRVQTKESLVWSEYIESELFTTPADQASCYIKNNGVWEKGKLYIKNENQWVVAKKIYYKKNGNWVQGTNN